MRTHADDRRTAWCDIFPGFVGDLNVFALKGRKPSGWHRHQQQVDQFFVAQGKVTFGFWTDDDAKADRPWPTYRTYQAGDGIIQIPTGVWHGYEAQTFSAVLVMYLSAKYNPADEEKKSFDEVPWAPPK